MAKTKPDAPQVPPVEGAPTPAPAPAGEASAVETERTAAPVEPTNTVSRAEYEHVLERFESARAGHDQVREQLRAVHAELEQARAKAEQLDALRAELEASAVPLRPVVYAGPPGVLSPDDPAAWRVVAFVVQGARAYLNGVLTQLKGGDFVSQPDEVRSLRGVEGIVLLGVASAAALEELRAWYAARVNALREQAAELGVELFPTGVVPPKTPRA